MFLGIVIPLFFGNLVNDGLKDLWLKPDDFDKWGETPGKAEVKIVRSFRLFNYTNVDEILNGTKAKLTELPRSTFQEYSKMTNWTYADEDEKELGRKKAGDFVLFTYGTNLSAIPNNSTTVPPDAPVTSLNFLTYTTFYTLTHSAPPLYMIPTMFEAKNALEQDFYFIVLTYVSWKKYFSDTVFTTNYLKSQGFDDPTLITDNEYGWGKWDTLKKWVESLIEYKKTGLVNSFEKIQMRFQTAQLIDLISAESLLYELIETIQADMLVRYGTNDPVTLGHLQWSTGQVTFNLPLDLGTLSLNNGVPLPSFLMLNQTFSTFPEIYFLQLAINISTPLFTQNVSNLLEVDYKYPRTNYQSFLNLNNLAVLFSNTTQAMENFNFNEVQVNVAKTYLGSLINFPVKAYGVAIDGYTLFLTKLAANMIVSQTVLLRNDAYWSVPTLLVFAHFSENSINCVDWISKVNSNLTSMCSSPIYGWNTTSNSWYNLQFWMKAAFKNESSSEFQTLAKTISASELNDLLYNTSPNLYQLTVQALQNTSSHFLCKKSMCNYEELFYSQWSTSKVTLSPPPKLTNYIKASTTMMTWVVNRYSLPIEWPNYSILPIEPLAVSALNYNSFLNPGIIRMFFNSYFQGNLTATAAKFQLPNTEYVKGMYTYLTKIIPGLSFFATKSYKTWMSGYLDPFCYYVNKLSIYQGGFPVVGYVYATASNSSDAGKPRSMVRSGRIDTKQTKFYYKYLGSRVLKKYSLSYDEYSPTMTTPSYKDIWAEDIDLTGGDGGLYGTQIDDEDVLTVFISAVMRNVNLTYDSDSTHHGLEVSKFLPASNSMKTEVDAPENAKYYQLAHGFNGFMNLTRQNGFPTFISFKRCYKCETNAQNMFDRFEYESVGKYGDKITPNSDDSPYVKVEPLTGTGVNVYLNLEFRIGFYNDYFFNSFYEPVAGKGVYFPAFMFERKAAIDKDQVEKFFGNLKFIQELRKIIFLIGIIVGSAFIVFALICVVLIYRSHKRFQSWSSPRNTTLKRYVTMKEKKEFEFESELRK